MSEKDLRERYVTNDLMIHNAIEDAEDWAKRAESERDALRAEVERLTDERDGFKALLWNIHMNLELSQNMNPDQMRHALDIIRALSEAGKE